MSRCHVFAEHGDALGRKGASADEIEDRIHGLYNSPALPSSIVALHPTEVSKMAEEKVSPPVTDVEQDALKNVDPKLEKHAHDADEAMKAMEGESVTIDETTNKRLLRIIDWHLMPIMCFVYGMNYLDSTAHEHSGG